MDRRFWDSAPNHPLTHLQRCVPSTRPATSARIGVSSGSAIDEPLGTGAAGNGDTPTFGLSRRERGHTHIRIGSKCITVAGRQHQPTVGLSSKWCVPTIGANDRRPKRCVPTPRRTERSGVSPGLETDVRFLPICHVQAGSERRGRECVERGTATVGYRLICSISWLLVLAGIPACQIPVSGGHHGVSRDQFSMTESPQRNLFK
jgi:hypothetical protein